MVTKVVVFDLWNTLVYDPSKENHEKISILLGFKTRQEFWDYCDEHFFNTKLTFYEFMKKLIKQRNLPKEIFDEIEELWEYARKHIGVFPDTVETLKKLKKKYKLVLLSNTAKKEGEESITRFGLKKYFDEVIFSGQIGLAKPNPRIFRLVLDHFDVNGEECVMVGDNLEVDIIPAKLLGFKTILVDTRKKYSEYKNEDWYVGGLKELEI